MACGSLSVRSFSRAGLFSLLLLLAPILISASSSSFRHPFPTDKHATATDPPLPPFPLDAVVAQAIKDATALPAPTPSGVTRQSYLDLISGTVLFFLNHQNLNSSSVQFGRIIDPFANEEIQYATPCFANAGALLVKEQYFNASFSAFLLTRVSYAMDAAITALIFGQPKGDQGCAQGHCNFYTMPLMIALETLSTLVPASTYASWMQQMSTIDPARSYNGWPHAAGNWAVVALTGEALRFMAGLRTTTADIDEQLAYQDTHYYWTDNGQYQDHSGCSGACSPMPYDHFPRKYIQVILSRNFSLTNASTYWERLRRAAWTSVLMQSPWGELPTGGRSSQHQWNEAVSCVTYEIWASKLAAEGNVAEAGIFKRAAALSVQSLRRWKQAEDGPWWVIKNRFDPALRHGYESYSFFSQYNLLPASMLATAFLFADDTIKEGNAFAEVGGFVFSPELLHKVIGNAGGNYVEIELYPDAPEHDALGLSRMHTRRADPFATGSAAIPGSLGTGYGPAWQVTAAGVSEHLTATPQGWQRLGMFPYTDVFNSSVQIGDTSPSALDFSVTYKLNPLVSQVVEVVETYHVDAQFVNVTVALTPKAGVTLSSQGMMFPVLVTDGQRSTTYSVDLATNTAMVEMPGDKISGLGVSCAYTQIKPSCGEQVTWTQVDPMSDMRNGFANVTLVSLNKYDPSCPLAYAFWAQLGPCRAM